MEINTSVLKKPAINNSAPEQKMPENLICFSHLRWDFVYQRPQHLLTRFATQFSVFFIEEPVFDTATKPYLQTDVREAGVTVVVPHLPENEREKAADIQKQLIDSFLEDKKAGGLFAWYYTPMALQFSSHIEPDLLVYDCMDELSNFKFAPPELRTLEQNLLSKADVVFTGGHSLYNFKKDLHKNIHPFPSSIDKKHFEQARSIAEEPTDQSNIPHPRFGFYGVIDERFDIDLIRNIATERPDWHLVILGPVVKIDPASLPQLPNIHYLGGKSYKELPAYLAGWDVAFIPFLLNDATRFISPTKTPEYLSAGVPVISTPITDVVSPYGNDGFVKIAANAEEFIAAGEELLALNKEAWLPLVDEYLAQQSWDLTYSAMMEKINESLIRKQL